MLNRYHPDASRFVYGSFLWLQPSQNSKSKKNRPVTINVYPSEVSKPSEDSKDNDPLEIKESIFIDREKDPYNFPKPKPNPRPNKK